MNWSKYNYIFNSKKYGNLLFNSLTNSFMQLNDSAYNFIIKNIDKPELITESEIGKILTDMKCLVHFDDDEINAISYIDILTRTNRQELCLTIAPTYHCNFACTYCYESSRPAVYMSDETQEQLLAFIKSFDIEDIDITWYGGEPLMGLGIINHLTKEIINGGKNITHSFIVTNGYLLNKRNIELLKKNNILEAQITIDGPKEIHDNRRPLTNNKGSFDKIINNIDNLFEIIPDYYINFRVNIDKSNQNDFVNIRNYLLKKYHNRNISVSPGFVDTINGCASINNCNFDRLDKVKFTKQIYKNHKIDLGIYPAIERNSCIAKSLNGYVIGADGDIFKCWNDIGIKEKAISNLSKPTIQNQSLYFRYLNSTNNLYDEKCKKCILLPICDGGCQYIRLENEYSAAAIDTCHLAKDNLEDFLELYYEAKNSSK